MAKKIVFCTDCLEDIPENELHFEAENREGLKVTLCRLCFLDSDYISDEMKQHFLAHEEALNG